MPSTKLIAGLLDTRVQRVPMSEEQATRLANEISKDAHRRRMEFILLILLGVIVLFALCYILFDKQENSEPSKWAMTTLTAVLGFITGFISARRNPDTPSIANETIATPPPPSPPPPGGGGAGGTPNAGGARNNPGPSPVIETARTGEAPQPRPTSTPPEP